jgi:hypothetical protein
MQIEIARFIGRMDVLEAMLGVFVIFCLCYLLSALLLGVVDHRRKARVPMEWCHKHGYFRAEHCLPLAGKNYVCPRCYVEAINIGKFGVTKH